ncbi:hypothetical protein L1987_15718 [Smallanthus sonchifolius]|uniref:Uncharacterized protein n=1 Tax=Smallanthus sonchifolius TaxID=185202 RepID=A0ACB9J8M8_9ASTR|nr:hypothetical protein L1987_15718 [Smallanthus sonchifolius]
MLIRFGTVKKLSSYPTIICSQPIKEQIQMLISLGISHMSKGSNIFYDIRDLSSFKVSCLCVLESCFILLYVIIIYNPMFYKCYNEIDYIFSHNNHDYKCLCHVYYSIFF